MGCDWVSGLYWIRYFEEMEGSRISASGRTGGWKQSVIKNKPTESRIFGQDRDLPTKFSPAKYAEPSGNTSKSLVKSKILSYSHDEIELDGNKERSRSRGRNLDKRLTLQTQRSKEEETQQIKLLNIQKVPSQRTLDLLSSPLRKPSVHRAPRETMEFVQEIKLQYLRFKEKVLGELKKLQEDIKGTVQELMAAVSKSAPLPNFSNHGNIARSSSLDGKLPSFGVLNEPMKLASTLPKVSLERENVDRSKYRELLGSDQNLQSILPRIRERMTRFFDIIGQLKTQINDPTLYSPIAFKEANSPPKTPE